MYVEKFPFWEKINIGNEKRLSKWGKVNDFSFIMSDKTITKIATLNKLYIPDVLISIIKDYLFYSVEQVLHRQFIDSIVGENDRFLYEWEITYTRRNFRNQLSICICAQCGNFSTGHLYGEINNLLYSSNVKCRCATHPYYDFNDRQNYERFLVDDNENVGYDCGVATATIL